LKKRAFLYIIMAGILWGTSGIFGNVLPDYGFTPFHITAVRGGVSFICIFVFALIKDRRLLKVKPLDLLLYLGIGISLFVTSACYYLAINMTSISTAVVLMYTAPIFVMAFSVMFFGEKLSVIKLCTVFTMLLGCVFVSGVIGGMKFDFLGIVIALLSGISYATYNILTKISMRRENSPITTTVYGFLFMAVISLTICEPWLIIENTAKSPAILVPTLLALGILTFVLPYFLYTLGMKELPAGTASALGIVEPMTATIFSITIFGEPISVFSAVGIILILSSVILLSFTENRTKNKKDVKK